MRRFRGLALVWEENWLVRVGGNFRGVDDEPTPGRKPRVSDEEILEIFQVVDEPVLTVGEIAERLPIGRRGLHDRLKNLEEDGVLSSKLAGQTMVWWSPEYTIVASDETDND
jgi:predicted HTH transcriptional regulator